jgi:hypothetical protein
MRCRFQIAHIIISVWYSLSLIAIFISISNSPNIHINMMPNVASFPWHFIGSVILFWNIFCMLFNFWFIFEGLRISRELKNFRDNEHK